MFANNRCRLRGQGLLLALAMMPIGLVGACGRGAVPSGAGPQTSQSPGVTTVLPPEPSTAEPSSPPAATRTRQPSRPRRTAADDLAPFFAACRGDDALIRAAAAAVNRGIGPTTVRFTPSTVAAVKASVPDRTAHAIPANLDSGLLRAVLLVYSELVSRSAAFNPVRTFGTAPRTLTDRDTRWLFDALRSGSSVARRYPGDVAAARALAVASPAITAVRPDSRPAAEVAVRIALIEGSNNCCGSAGGHLATRLAPITWKTEVNAGGRWDGTIQGIRFRATYAPGSGWKVLLAAG